eukprot:scpid78496/ scgid1407/ Eukaryotic translation initiation factor 4B
MEGSTPQQGGGKKKKKEKKTKMTLDQFLDKTTVTTRSSTSWADASEEAASDGRYYEPAAVDLHALPKAPRAALGPSEVDLSRLPQRPPFVAYIGNLPYDIVEEDIQDFFKSELAGIRLPTEGGGRIKGFGYAEFHTRTELAEGLKLNGEMLKNRRIKVDLASNNDDGRGGPGMRNPFEEDRTTGDWRNGPAKDAYEPAPQRGGDRYDGGGSRYESRGGFGDGDRYDSRGGGGDRYESRGGGYGGGDRYESRGGGDRDERFDSRRGGRTGSPNRADLEDNWRRGPPPSQDDRGDRRGDDRAGPYGGSSLSSDSGAPRRNGDGDRHPSGSSNGDDSGDRGRDRPLSDRDSRSTSRPGSRSPSRYDDAPGRRTDRGQSSSYEDRGQGSRYDDRRQGGRYDDRG